MSIIPFTVSFDALSTLIQITNGIGFQYRTAFAEYLREHNIDLDTSCPSASNENVQKMALSAIQAEMKVVRAAWTGSDNPKEAPYGGNTNDSLEQFWTKVIARTFQSPALYEGASPQVVEQITALRTEETASLRRFEHHLIFDVFGSTKAYSWLPESLRTLQCLREWNQQRLSQQQQQQQSTGEAHAARLVLAAPPFVVSNMDPLLRPIFTQLGAFTPGENGEPPLLSRIIVASDVGFAKPSPVGLLTGVRDIKAGTQKGHGVLSEAAHNIDMRHHVHVGDAEADRLASERAGCVYVECDDQIGVTWEQLRAAIEKMERSCVGQQPSSV